MKQALIIIFLTGSLRTFSQAPLPQILSDTSKVAILQRDSLKAFILSADDLAAAERVLNIALDREFGIVNKKKKKGIDIRRYYIQVVPYLNAENEKEVWVNCFCSLFGFEIDWKKNIFGREMILDGGSCYFDLIINLNQLKYYRFGMNGLG